MLYIVEGPDGAGKTTYCEKLRRVLGIKTTSIMHHGSYRQADDIVRFYHDPILRYVTQTTNEKGDLIFDRSWISELVYREAMNEKCRLSSVDVNFLNYWAMRCPVVVIYYIPEYDVCLNAWTVRKEMNGELVTETETYRRVYDLYKKFAQERIINLPTRVITERVDL